MCKKELLDKAFTEAVTEEEILEEFSKITLAVYVFLRKTGVRDIDAISRIADCTAEGVGEGRFVQEVTK